MEQIALPPGPPAPDTGGRQTRTPQSEGYPKAGRTLALGLLKDGGLDTSTV